MDEKSPRSRDKSDPLCYKDVESSYVPNAEAVCGHAFTSGRLYNDVPDLQISVPLFIH
jgi:hypothetical protein